MAETEGSDEGLRGGWPSVRQRGRRLGRSIFGDRTGLVVWLGLLLAFALLWRVGIFLTDTYTVANTLVNVADGHLAITKVEYSLTASTQPGLHQYDGVLYGRNYGQAFFALPFLWLLEAAAVLAEPRFVLLGGWALGSLVFARQLGVVLDRPAPFALAGSAVAILAMVVGVGVGTPLDPDALALTALQLSTIVAAASVGLLVYRLLATFEGRRVGIASGVAAGIATPIGFWASIPKRHVLVAMLVVGAVYCFARSRQTGSTRLRAGAYVFAGLVAWVHAFEGFFVVVALGSVDLVTARENGWRELGVISLALLLALSPTFATNVAIAGNPVQSPRLLPSVGVGGVELAPSGDLQATDRTGGVRTGSGGGDLLGSGTDEVGDTAGESSGDVTGSATGGDATTTGSENRGGGPLSWLFGLLAGIAGALIGLLPRPPDTVLVILSFILTTVTDGLAVLGQPGRLVDIFLRGGHAPGVYYEGTQFEVIDLTVLESMPLLAGLLAVPALAVAKLGRAGRGSLHWPRSLSPARQTDLLVAVLAIIFTVIYLSRLPLSSMFTVRYLLPIYPLGLYALARLTPVSGAINERPRKLAGAYVGTLVLGGAVLYGLLSAIDPALGEAAQVHALVNLAVAAALAVAVVARVVTSDRVSPSRVATALGVAAGFTTLYLAFASLAYFPYGAFAMDAVRVFAESLATLV